MENLEQYNGKRVLVTTKNGDEANEIEGTVESGNPLGLLIKPKGKTNLVLLEIDQVIEIKVVTPPVAQKALKAKKLRKVELGQARTHLLERHGYSLKDINAMTEEAAFEFHASLDHVSLDLGHVHADAEPVVEAIADEEDSSSE